MKNFIKAIDGLPKIIKLILALPALDIVWAIYRICRSAVKKNILGVILGIIMIPLGGFILWILDIVTILVKDTVLWFD